LVEDMALGMVEVGKEQALGMVVEEDKEQALGMELVVGMKLMRPKNAPSCMEVDDYQ